MKRCSKCDLPKEYTEFGYWKYSKDGYKPACKQCTNKSVNNYRKMNSIHHRNLQISNYNRNKSKVILRARKWKNENKEKASLVRQKTTKVTHWYRTLAKRCLTSKKYSYEYDIDAEYILEVFNEQQGKCYWFGIPLIPSIKPRSPYQPSIDRLDINKGYVKGNIVISSQFANLGRSTQSVDEFKQFISQLRNSLIIPT